MDETVMANYLFIAQQSLGLAIDEMRKNPKGRWVSIMEENDLKLAAAAAERERCARIAEDYAKEAEGVIEWPEDQLGVIAAERIAKRIRGEK